MKVKSILRSVLIASMLLQLSCGTLLYPERKGQLDGRIDPAIAILNGIGILVYVIPGLAAFAVDFYTGAIYLPGGKRGKRRFDGASTEYSIIHLPPADINPETIEDLYFEHTGKVFSFQTDTVEAHYVMDRKQLAYRLAPRVEHSSGAPVLSLPAP